MKTKITAKILSVFFAFCLVLLPVDQAAALSRQNSETTGLGAATPLGGEPHLTDPLKAELSANGNPVTQYVNQDDGRLKTILWVKGITPPKMGGDDSDFVRKPTYGSGGETTFIEYIAPYAPGNGWFDVNKSSGRELDRNLCFAATASNMLHWWLAQNDSNITRYLQNNPDYPKKQELESLRNSFRSQSDSGIYKKFVQDYAYNQNGYWSDILVDLIINGYPPKPLGGTNGSDLDKEKLLKTGPDKKGGFFFDVFDTTLLTKRANYRSNYQNFSNDLKSNFLKGNIVGLEYQLLNIKHIVTLWGAEFDSDGNLSAVYFTDSDDDEANGMARYMVKNVDGRPFVSTRTDNKGNEIDYLEIVSLGEDVWQKSLQEQAGGPRRTVLLSWGNTDLTYNGTAQQPALSFDGKQGSDEISVSVSGGQTDVGSYQATAVLTGSDAGKYRLPYHHTSKFTIRKADPSILLTAAPTRSAYGTPVLLSASISGANGEKPGGTVTFRGRGKILADKVPVTEGVARFSLTGQNAPDAASYRITAEFTPDQNGTGKNYNSTSASVNIQVEKASAPAIVFPSAGDLVYGQTLSASTLLGGSPDSSYGYFAWRDGSIAPEAGGHLYDMVFHPSRTAPGNYDGFAEKQKKISVTVNRAVPEVALSVTVSEGDSGRQARLSVSVRSRWSRGAAPAGTVRFFRVDSGGESLLSEIPAANLQNGSAAGIWDGLPLETHRIKAVYGGDGNYTGASSVAVSFDARVITPDSSSSSGGINTPGGIGIPDSGSPSGRTNTPGSAGVAPAPAPAPGNVGVAPAPAPGNAGKIGGGGGIAIVPVPAPAPAQELPNRASVVINSSVSGDTAHITIPADLLSSAVSRAREKAGASEKSLSVDIRADGGSAPAVSGFSANLPEESIVMLIKEEIAEARIQSSAAQIGIHLETLKEIRRQLQEDVIVSAKKADKNDLPRNINASSMDRPVFQLTISGKSGKKVTDFGSGKVTVLIPYVPKENEKPSDLFVYHIDEKGKKSEVPGSAYNPDQKALQFDTVHFSLFAVGHRNDAEQDTVFYDIEKHWAKESIGFVTKKGLFRGTGNGKFSPDAPMTRGMFVTVLGRLAGIDPGAYTDGGFADVKDGSYYLPYIRWAEKNGIVHGVGNGRFAPDHPITREQMAAVLAGYAASSGLALPQKEQKSDFADGAAISGYAKDPVRSMQMAGILAGKGNGRFDPKETATRAEVSAVLMRFAELSEKQ